MRRVSYCINILEGNDLSPEGDINIVIDVLRAFTTTHYMFLKGWEEIYLVKESSDAFALKEQMKDSLVAGETGGYKVEGFDFGNSPQEMITTQVDIQRNLIMKTTNGVKAALSALKANVALATGLTNALTTAKYSMDLCPQGGVINLVATNPRSEEDRVCAEYMKAYILGEDCNTQDIIDGVLQSQGAKKFLDPSKPEFSPKDLELCSQFLENDFIMKIVSEDGYTKLRKVMV